MKNSKKLKLVCSAMLQSWRIRSLGPSQRYTELAPTKSGIIGMIACALGYERDDKRIEALVNSTELYLDVKNSGSMLESATINSIDTLIDYQTVMDKEKGMPTADFRKLVKSRVDDEVSKCLTSIQQKIVDNKLQGHNFYIYVLPFTDINSKRKKIMEAITK